MATKTSTRKHWKFLDRFRREIEPEHVRAKFSGDVFLGWNPEDLPPAGTQVEIRVKAVVGPPSLKATGEEETGPYVAIAPFKVREAHDLVILVPEPEPTEQVRVEDLLPEGADSVTIAHPASATSVKIERDGPARSARRAKAASRNAGRARSGGRPRR